MDTMGLDFRAAADDKNGTGYASFSIDKLSGFKAVGIGAYEVTNNKSPVRYLGTAGIGACVGVIISQESAEGTTYVMGHIHPTIKADESMELMLSELPDPDGLVSVFLVGSTSHQPKVQELRDWMDRKGIPFTDDTSGPADVTLDARTGKIMDGYPWDEMMDFAFETKGEGSFGDVFNRISEDMSTVPDQHNLADNSVIMKTGDYRVQTESAAILQASSPPKSML